MTMLEQENKRALAIKAAMAGAAAAARAAVGGTNHIREDIDVPESVVSTEMNEKEILKATEKAKNKKVGRSVKELLKLKAKK